MDRPPQRPAAWQERLVARLLNTLAPAHAGPEGGSPPPALLPYEKLSIERRRGGEKLSGTWYPAYVGPRGAVLLLHPWTREGQAYFHRHGRLDALRAAGYHALTLDFPGFGTTPSAVEFDDRTVDDGLRLLERRSDGLELFVWGVSWGGLWAHLALTKTDQVAGAVFEDVPCHAFDWLRRSGRLPRALDFILRRLFAGPQSYLDVREHALCLDLGAVSYLSGSRDSMVRPEETRRLAVRAQGSSNVVQGAGHLEAITHANRAVLRTALETFERASDNSTTAVLVPPSPAEPAAATA